MIAKLSLFACCESFPCSFQDSKIPSSLSFTLEDFSFNDFPLDDQQTLQATIRMFIDLEFIEKFHINYEVGLVIDTDIETLVLSITFLLSIALNYYN